jgi:hypothetical protein
VTVRRIRTSAMGVPDTMRLRALSQSSTTLLIDVVAPGEPRTVEIALDSNSGPGIRHALVMKPFKERYGSDYTYWLNGLSCVKEGRDWPESDWAVRIRVKLGRRNRDLKVPCSRAVYYQLWPLFHPEPSNMRVERPGA